MNDAVSADAILKRVTKHYIVMIQLKNWIRVIWRAAVLLRQAAVGQRISGDALRKLQVNMICLQNAGSFEVKEKNSAVNDSYYFL